MPSVAFFTSQLPPESPLSLSRPLVLFILLLLLLFFHESAMFLPTVVPCVCVCVTHREFVHWTLGPLLFFFLLLLFFFKFPAPNIYVERLYSSSA